MFKQKVIFDKELCSEILTLCNEWYRSKVYSNDGEQEFELSNFRKSSQSIHYTNRGDKVFSSIANYVSDLNLSITADKLKYMVCKYEQGEFVKHHNDLYGGSSRKFSLVAQLSDSDSYSGGDFAYYSKSGKLLLERDLGNALIFPCQQYHEVEKVISGTRYSFVMFLSEDQISSNKSAL